LLGRLSSPLTFVYFVYILQCGDKTLYTGITTDVVRRLKEHKEGTGSNYTRARGAVKILHSEKHPDRSAASRREAAIKRLSRGKKLHLIQQGV
jgi:putative endonuclease